MFDFGFSEILLTSAIALVVLGPERLPKVARQVGNWMGRARAMARQLSDQLEREVSADEFLKQQNQAKAPLMNRIAPPALPALTESTVAPAESALTVESPAAPSASAASAAPSAAEPHAEYEPPAALAASTVHAPSTAVPLPPVAPVVHNAEASTPPNE